MEEQTLLTSCTVLHELMKPRMHIQASRRGRIHINNDGKRHPVCEASVSQHDSSKTNSAIFKHHRKGGKIADSFLLA